MTPQLYSTEEAANLLGVTPARVRQMIASGVLSTLKVGKVHLITQAGLEKAKRRRTKPGPVPQERSGTISAKPTPSHSKKKR